MQTAQEPAQAERQARGLCQGVVDQGDAGEFAVREEARFGIREDRLGDREGGDPGHRGQQGGLAPGGFGPEGGVCLFALPEDELAVDLVGGVVQPLTQSPHGPDIVAREVAGQQRAVILVRHSRTS